MRSGRIVPGEAVGEDRLPASREHYPDLVVQRRTREQHERVGRVGEKGPAFDP